MAFNTNEQTTNLTYFQKLTLAISEYNTIFDRSDYLVIFDDMRNIVKLPIFSKHSMGYNQVFESHESNQYDKVFNIINIRKSAVDLLKQHHNCFPGCVRYSDDSNDYVFALRFDTADEAVAFKLTYT